MRQLGVLLILLTVGGCAARPQSSPSPLPLAQAPKNPDDAVVAFLRPTRSVTPDEMADAYPEGARRADLSGTTLVNCLIIDRGAVDDCRVVSENPPGWGFGEASVKLARLFRWQTVNRDGQSTIGHRKTTRITLTLH